MLHIKFHDIQPTGSGEKDFQWVLTLYGLGSHIGHMSKLILIYFHFLVPTRESVKPKDAPRRCAVVGGLC